MSYSIDNLLPVTQYILTVWAQKDNIASDPRSVTFTTGPAPDPITMINVNENQLSFASTWLPDKRPDFFIYQVDPPNMFAGVGTVENVFESGDVISPTNNMLFFGETQYTVTVRAQKAGVYSIPTTYTFTTGSAPDPVTILNVSWFYNGVDEKFTTFFKWGGLTEPDSFFASYSLESIIENVYEPGDVIQSMNSVEFLNPNTEYPLTIYARKGRLISEATYSFTTGEGPLPVAQSSISVVNNVVSFMYTWVDTAPVFQYLVVGLSGWIQNDLVQGLNSFIIDLELSAVTNYTLKLMMLKDGVSSAPTSYSFTTGVGPDPVTNVSVVGDLLSFTYVGEPDRFKYVITLDGEIVGEDYVTEFTNNISTTISFPLQGETVYTVNVVAVKSSISSAPTSHTFTTGAPPDPVTNVSVVGDLLSFTYVGEPDRFKYVITSDGEVFEEDYVTEFTNNISTTISFPLQGETAYTVNVVAVKSSIYSAPTSHTFTTGAPPDPVTTASVVGHLLSFVSTWDTMKPDKFKYEIRMDDMIIVEDHVPNVYDSGDEVTITLAATGTLVIIWAIKEGVYSNPLGALFT
jgi:hypothetical protein